jgi:hypothetical protein
MKNATKKCLGCGGTISKTDTFNDGYCTTMCHEDHKKCRECGDIVNRDGDCENPDCPSHNGYDNG